MDSAWLDEIAARVSGNVAGARHQHREQRARANPHGEAFDVQHQPHDFPYSTPHTHTQPDWPASAPTKSASLCVEAIASIADWLRSMWRRTR